MLGFLRPGFGRAVVIVLHRGKNQQGELVGTFSKVCALPVIEIGDKDAIRPDMVFVAPSNYHVLFERSGSFSLDVSDAVWYSKPSIDVTFESAADCCGSKCAAILLSGANPDGAQGLLKLKSAGALTIAQDINEAEMPEMPQAAINAGAADFILTSKHLFHLLKC